MENNQITHESQQATGHHSQQAHKRLQKLKKRRARNITLNTIASILVLGGILWASRFFWRYTVYEITNDATIDQYVVPVNIRVPGYIKDVRFTEHQLVKAGDTLVTLDDSEYRIKLMDAEAALNDAEAAARSMHSGILISDKEVDIYEANLAETKAKLWKLEQDHKRYADLLAEESVSQQQFEQADADYKAMKAHHNSLLLQQESARLSSTEMRDKYRSAEANIMRKRADLDMAKLNLSYTFVTAPYDGYMGRRTLESGQLVQAGQSLTYIIRGDRKWVTANYKETQIADIYVGQEVTIRVDAFKGKKFRGQVTAISEATGSKYSLVPTDNSAGNFVKIQQRIPVRIDFVDVSAEDMQRLRAGMMVETEAKIK